MDNNNELLESVTHTLRGRDPMLIKLHELEQLAAKPGEVGAYLAGVLSARLCLLAAGVVEVVPA